MKRCTNPACNTNYVFGDRYTVCPFCHQPLSVLGEENRTFPRVETIRSPYREQSIRSQEETEPFFEQKGRTIRCHGRVTEVDADSVFQNRKQKWFQTLWYGEPYQMSQQSVHTVICVEELSRGMAGQVKDFTMYGSIGGKVHPGDEVELIAKDVKDQRVITRLWNRTTESQVRARLLIPAFLFRWILGSILLFLLGVLYIIYDFFHSGAAAAFASALIGPLAICAIIGYGIYSAIRSAFPGKRRRGGWFL